MILKNNLKIDNRMRSAIYATLLSSYSVQNFIMMCQINAKFFSLSIAIGLLERKYKSKPYFPLNILKQICGLILAYDSKHRSKTVSLIK